MFYSLSSLLAWASAKKASQKVISIYQSPYSGTDLRTLLYGEHTHLTTILNSEHFSSGFTLEDLLIKYLYTFHWLSPYFQKYTKDTYAGKVLAKSNISGFIVCGNAHLLFIKCGGKFLEELFDHTLLLCCMPKNGNFISIFVLLLLMGWLRC